MRKYLHINLGDRTIETEEKEGEAVIRAGRNFIVRTLLEAGAATVDPLSRSEEHTCELQSRRKLVCRLPLEKKKKRHVSSEER